MVKKEPNSYVHVVECDRGGALYGLSYDVFMYFLPMWGYV